MKVINTKVQMWGEPLSTVILMFDTPGLDDTNTSLFFFHIHKTMCFVSHLTVTSLKENPKIINNNSPVGRSKKLKSLLYLTLFINHPLHNFSSYQTAQYLLL